MPTLPFPDRVREMLAQPNHAVMATLRRDGQPVTVPTWYRLDGDEIVVNLDAGRKRLQHLRDDPRISLTVLDGRNWYTHVSVLGSVVRIEPDPDLSGIDRLAMHYNGRPYPNRNRPRFDAWIQVDRWHAWGDLKS